MADDLVQTGTNGKRAGAAERGGGARLGSLEVSGLSLAGLAPTMAMALGTTFAASEAGPAAPLSYVLAMIGSFSLAFVIVRFARRYDRASGVAFTYVGAALGKLAGFLAGWLYAAAWTSGITLVLGIASVSSTALLARHGIHVGWFWIFLALLLIAVLINYVGVRPSVRLLVALELSSMGVLAVLAIHIIIHGGATGASWKPFDWSLSPKGWSGIGYGMIFGFSGFAGFEAAAALGRESRDPGRVIPRAIVSSLLAAATFYILVTYALSIGYGVGQAGAWAADPAPLDTIIGRYSGTAWAQVIDAMVVISAFSAALGLITLSSRILFDISRHGQAPRWFSAQHRRFGTPSAGIVSVAVITLVIGGVVGGRFGVSGMIGFIAGASTLGLIVVYAVTSAAAIINRQASRAGGRAPSTLAMALAIAIPALAVVLLGFALYASVVPSPPYPNNLTPVAVAAVLVLSLIGAMILRRRDTDLQLQISED
jgi:amino acid transporter